MRCILPILIFSLCLIACTSGCVVPATLPQVPGLSGRVIDPLGKPVPGATVVISQTDSWRGPDFQKQVDAGADGSFDRKEEQRWFLWLVPAETFPTPLRVHAEHDGRRSEPKTVLVPGGVHLFGIGHDRGIDLGDICLTGD
jgi:hypothetical protein